MENNSQTENENVSLNHYEFKQWFDRISTVNPNLYNLSANICLSILGVRMFYQCKHVFIIYCPT